MSEAVGKVVEPRRRWQRRAVVALLLLTAAGVWPLMRWLDEREWRYAAASNFDAATVSSDLDADLRLMWQTQAMRSTPGGMASTLAAVLASSRVFNTVELVGRTGAEVRALLGSPNTSNDSVYRGQPMFPVRARALIYRFDTGVLGWEFHVLCQGDDQPVTAVDRFAIE